MKRPFSVTILLWLVLSLTVWSGLRLASAIQWWGTLLEFASPPGPLYIAISAGIWLIVGIGVVVGHVAGQSLDTVRAARDRSRLHSLVLVRPAAAPNLARKLALRLGRNRSVTDRCYPIV